MSTGSAPWRALVRLAWRDTLRHKGRTALVIALIGVPVAMMLVASVLIRTTITSLDEERLVQMGPVADLVVWGVPSPDGSRARPTGLPALPAGARSVAVKEDYGVRMPVSGRPERKGRPLFVNTITAPFADPILSGFYLLRSGAWPITDDGIAITDSLAGYARLRVGDTINLVTPKRTVRVTGVFEQRDNLLQHAFATASPLLPNTQDNPAAVWIDLGPNVSALDAKKVAEGLVGKGWTPKNTSLFPGVFNNGLNGGYENPRETEGTPIAIMNVAGVILLFVLGTIVTAAFAVGARRQLRTLGLIAANGGDPRQLRRLVTLQGTVAAAVGAIFGFALGGIGLAFFLPHLNSFTHRIQPGVELAPFDVVMAFAMALLAGSLAAAFPGRAVARVPVLNALGGRRPLKQLSNALPVAGLVIAGLGVLLLAASTARGNIGNSWAPAALGGVMVLLGGVIISPWHVGRLAPLALRLGGAGRLATRRMTRHRSRSGPIVAAIMATGAVAVAVSTLAGSVDRGQRKAYSPYVAPDQVYFGLGGGYALYPYGPIPQDPAPPDPVLVDQMVRDTAAAVTAILPGSTVVRYESVYDMSVPGIDGKYYRLANPISSSNSEEGLTPSVSIVIGNTALLRALKLSDTIIDAFESGRAIVGGPGASTTVDLLEQSVVQSPSASQESTTPNERRIRFQAVVAPEFDLGQRNTGSFCDRSGKCRSSHTTNVIVPASIAIENGLSHSPEVTVFAPSDITKSQRDALQNLQQDLYDAAEDRSGSPTKQIVPQLHYENNSFAPVRLIELILTGVALLLALGVTAVSLALTATDNRADDSTLASLGASPGIRRRLRAWEAWLLAAMGMGLAVPFGFLPAIAILQAQPSKYGFVFPWLTVGLLVVAVPLIAAAVGWLSTRSPRRVGPTTE
jgi:putative ABC transport system permease protein